MERLMNEEFSLTFDETHSTVKSISIHDVANQFLYLSIPGSKYSITPLKLQKLLYYAQGENIKENNKVLFEEKFKAWKHGPVNEEIYHKYKKYGYQTIPKASSSPNLNNDTDTIINEVWNRYGHYDGKFLEELTHQETPWLKTKRNNLITVNFLEEHFKEKRTTRK